jgi:hypothetical protein
LASSPDVLRILLHVSENALGQSLGEQRGKWDQAGEEADTTRGRPGVAFFSDHLFSDSLPGKNFSTVDFSVATFLRVNWHLVLVAGCARREFCRCLPSESRESAI